MFCKATRALMAALENFLPGKFLIFFFQNSGSWYYLKVLMSLAFITKLLNTGTHDHLTETHNQSFLYINENILEKNVKL